MTTPQGISNVPLPDHKKEQNKHYRDHLHKELTRKDTRANPPMAGDEDETRNTGKEK